MPSSGRRRLAAAFALAVLGTSSSPLATAGDDLIACRQPGQITVHKDNWTEIAAPPMDVEEGPREVVDYAAAPNLANRLYVTNGRVIKVSEDGGCTWNYLWGGTDYMRIRGVDQQRPDIFTDLSASGPDNLWVASYDDSAGVFHPHVRVMGGLGPSDPQPPPPPLNIDNGIPAVGVPLDLQAASAMDTAAHLLVEEPADPASGDLETPTHKLYTLYRPDLPDQANALEQLVWKELTAPDGFGRIEGFTMAPLTTQLWVWSDTNYATVLDVQADEPVWIAHPSPGGQITSVDATTKGIALVAAKRDQGYVTQTADKTGKIIGSPNIPILPTTMTHGTRPEMRVVGNDKEIWGYDSRLHRWENISPSASLRSLSTGMGRVERLVYGMTKNAVWRFDTYPGETFVPIDDSLFGRGYPPAPHSTITEPYIDVKPDVVTVKPGQVKDAAVEFGMPPAATPLDVFFLVDTTGSMSGAILGLRKDIKSIADGLRANLGHAACFGVGDFKDQTALDTTKVFRTHLSIAPTCASMDDKLTPVNEALKQLSASSGGDDPEAQTIALTQMISGTGQTSPLVLPGQSARFRREAYKVAVLITDAAFKTGPGYPTLDDTVETLNVAGVKVVSVQLITNLDPALARADLTELAQGTDTMAPEGGVDCDGDGAMGYGDLHTGDPLICEANGAEPNIGPVIMSLLLGVEDPGTSAVDVDDPDHAITGTIHGVTSQIVNLKRQSLLPFTVPVSCTKEQDGQDLTVHFTPSIRALPVGIAADLTVQCRSEAAPAVDPPTVVEPEPEILGKPRQPQMRAIVPPPQPPVQPVTNMTLNAGFSQQEEQQFQLAAVTQGAGEVEEAGEELELAMTGLDRPERTMPAAAFLGGAMTIAAAAGLAHRRRLQRSRQVAYARVKR